MMQLEDILKAVRQLPAEDRRQLIRELVQDFGPEPSRVSEASRRAALERWVARAGTAHADFTDVSSDKHKHLAEVYSDRR